MTEPVVPARTLDDRYLLVEPVEADEHHEGWRGHDDIASRPVLATIYLDVAPGDEWRDRFDQTARRLEALTHPGLASTLAHDARANEPWLVTAAVDGDRVDQILIDDDGLSPDDAMAVIGQTAIAVKAAHDVGIAHGSIDAQHIVVRSDGSSALIGFEVPSTHRSADDLTALAALTRELLPEPASGQTTNDEPGADIPGFVRWVGGAAATDAGEIGRTALALAAAIRGAHSTTVVGTKPPVEGDDEGEPEIDRNRPWYDDAERKRVRNGLIAIGTIVVVGGAALLWVIDRGGGPNEATVPYVISEPLKDAQNELLKDLLVADPTITDPDGIVTAQSPAAGTRVKVGTHVTLTISENGP